MSEFFEQQKLTEKQKILSVADELFYTLGVSTVAIDRIIAEAGVTQATFDQYFASKSALIIAFLEGRHVEWMEWFSGAIGKHNNIVDGVSSAMSEWFMQNTFRGCPFLNALCEASAEMPEIRDIAALHKQEVNDLLKTKLQVSADADDIAQAILMAMDGAIASAQSGGDVQQTTVVLYKTISLLVRA